MRYGNQIMFHDNYKGILIIKLVLYKAITELILVTVQTFEHSKVKLLTVLQVWHN